MQRLLCRPFTPDALPEDLLAHLLRYAGLRPLACLCLTCEAWAAQLRRLLFARGFVKSMAESWLRLNPEDEPLYDALVALRARRARPPHEWEPDGHLPWLVASDDELAEIAEQRPDEISALRAIVNNVRRTNYFQLDSYGEDILKCVAEHPRAPSRASVRNLSYERHLFKLLSNLFTAATLRLTPNDYVQLLVEHADTNSTVAGEDEDGAFVNDPFMWWARGEIEFNGCAHVFTLEAFSDAAGKLLLRNQWTASLVTRLSHTLIEEVIGYTEGQTCKWADADDAAYAARDLREVYWSIEAVADETGQSELTTPAILDAMSRAKTKDDASAFLLEVYGNHMLEHADIDLSGLKRIAAVAAQLDGASVVSLIDVLNACAASAKMKKDPCHLNASFEPYLTLPPLSESARQWSRWLLTTWLDLTSSTGWARLSHRLYKPLVAKSVAWLQRWFDDCCDAERVPHFFSATEAQNVAAELGALAGRLRLDVRAIATLLTGFASSEENFRRHVGDSFGSESLYFRASDLEEHHACRFLEAWARDVDFPAAYSAADCATLADALRQWPRSFRKEAALLAIRWIDPKDVRLGVVQILDALTKLKTR